EQERRPRRVGHVPGQAGQFSRSHITHGPILAPRRFGRRRSIRALRSPAMTLTLTRYRDVTAILADRRFDVPAAPPASHGLAWLRGAVSRFSRGALHARRRELATALLPPPAQLRAAAARLAADPGATPQNVPVTVL